MILFISDLHLSPRSPGATCLFRQFLAGRARQATELYILGDLFEAWIGDDDLADPFNAEIVAGLRAAAESGLKISAMHGNRDFLLGAGFAAASGVKLVNDPYILSTAEWQFVLSHGDALCLDDTAYMAFRAQARNLEWQAALLAKPLAERRIIAAQMREISESSQRDKANPYTDLQPAATDDFLREHGYATFIHGHTHQPAMHDHIVDGIHVERWVLADWHEERGECLVWDGEALRREAILPEKRS
ncbi:UDP-2,3-diacylglucosamine diphosphatase [Dechloromonas denitrificans]|uniref:UDP-2,3-diacylglucosamine diphosphatase n=1 Tax=Dechloromonas denitrificans TaxID=281362 RepID=UPI001CF83913|nr:UDP-2,3-diacylglucosamine diphosphatase [Dechloromonas denitrificans]UCV02842.1 UDP-2,3-diacylglucosamine diphosphatase [Dechloromonas denitrificans]UCV07150.1 UDP-2,3-diacylglucosamine diphosphatase [Dechloromonas denitrificans]